MAKYRALVSFTGTVSMAGGEVREISDQSLANSLLKVGYIEPFRNTEKPSAKTEEKPSEKPTEKVENPKETKTKPPKRGGKKNDN